ncbi:MAG TPA: hypothetical protein VLR90_05130 [Blastocatellia bacterium]|nr:hypothetical protein [Blastocatellia bacterium]
MKKQKAILTTTHVDRHFQKMSLSALESVVDLIGRYHIPFIVEHDPRIPPIGRIAEAHIKQLEDGEYGVEATIEMYELGEDIPMIDDSREIPLHDHRADKLEVMYDRNFQTLDDQLLIRDVASLFGTEPKEEVKKAFDPLTVLTIGGAFLLGGIAKGFLSKLGGDSYDLLKDRLKKLMGRKKPGEKEKLLSFQFIIQYEDYTIETEMILTNPTDDDIERVLANGMQELDRVLPRYCNPASGIKKAVFEYSDGVAKFKYGIRKDAAPLIAEHSE